MSHSQVISLEDYRRRREPRRHLADFSGHYEVYASAAAFVTAISLGTLLMMMRGPAQGADVGEPGEAATKGRQPIDHFHWTSDWLLLSWMPVMAVGYCHRRLCCGFEIAPSEGTH
jgi:hypothetical protein